MEKINTFYSLPLSNPYQVGFLKNFELLKSKYRRQMSPNLELDLWKSFYDFEGQSSFFEKMYWKIEKIIQFFFKQRYIQFEEQTLVSPKKIYVFLGLLTIFEFNLEKHHGNFVLFFKQFSKEYLCFFFCELMAESRKLAVFSTTSFIQLSRESSSH